MSTIKFRPMPGKIVVKIKTADKSPAGIILLSETEYSRIGEVVAIYEPFNYHVDRPEDMTEPYVKVGDLVLFGRNNGVMVNVERERVIVLKESEILAIIETEE